MTLISMTPGLALSSRSKATAPTPRFSGNQADSTTAATTATADADKEAAFKALGDTVVLQQGSEMKTVAQMAVILCTKAENYPGYGTVDALSDRFPGLDTKALDDAFEKLAFAGYLTSNYGMKMGIIEACEIGSRYVVTPVGLEALQKAYPDLALPPEGSRFVANYTPNN